MIFQGFLDRGAKKIRIFAYFCTIQLYFMKKIGIINIVTALSIGWFAQIHAQQQPAIRPTAVFTTAEGETGEPSTAFSGSAPVRARFSANVEQQGTWNAWFEWRFTLEGQSAPYLVRHEKDTEVTFDRAGVHRVVLYAVFTSGQDSVKFTEAYWHENEPISVSIAESKLEFPNAFSPNGDGINDVYKAKSGYRSIVEFRAIIFNRWGQKLFEWTDPAAGWDGRSGGKEVKQGVYFVLVKAKGADGKTYNIRKDVNLLRGFGETSGSTTQ